MLKVCSPDDAPPNASTRTRAHFCKLLSIAGVNSSWYQITVNICIYMGYVHNIIKQSIEHEITDVSKGIPQTENKLFITPAWNWNRNKQPYYILYMKARNAASEYLLPLPTPTKRASHRKWTEILPMNRIMYRKIRILVVSCRIHMTARKRIRPKGLNLNISTTNILWPLLLVENFLNWKDLTNTKPPKCPLFKGNNRWLLEY